MNKKGQEIYFSEKTARMFAEREENVKHETVAEIIAITLVSSIQALSKPWHIADLGAGAHPDRYRKLFQELGNEGIVDWVEASPIMIRLAKEYLVKKDLSGRLKIIKFVQQDALEYLKNLDDNSIDGFVMKYTFEDVVNIDQFLALISIKLKKRGVFVATIQPSPEIKSIHSNARYLYRGEEFPEDETRTLEDCEEWKIKFFKETNNPDAGYLEGIETVKIYHSPEHIRVAAENAGLKYFLGNWKEILSEIEQKIELNQTLLVLAK